MRDLNLLIDTSSSKLVWLSREELDQKNVDSPAIFLGILDGIYHFAVSVTQDQFPDQQLLKTNPSYRFTDIRTCGELLESEDSGIAAQARIQMNWHDKYAYCSSCGFKTKMKRALDEFIIEGIKTTIPFHRKLMDDPAYNSGVYTTKFMEDFSMED